MQSCVAKIGVVLLLAAIISGCGGGSSSNKNAVAQVTLTPATLSLVAGEVFTSLQFTALNSAGVPLTAVPTFTFNSSNTRFVTIAPDGKVCAGVWDSFFVVCNGTDASGNPLVGSALITATADGVSSAPVPVSVHPSVTSITVDAVSGCTSIKGTQQFVAHALHNGVDITNEIGNFSWSVTSGSVATIDSTSGLATATGPGVTGVIANAGTTSSPAVSFRSCMPVSLSLHVSADTPTSATLNVNDTKTLQVDMVDENNVTTTNAPITIFSNNTQVASISGTTLTGVSPGGAGLVAACVPPTCGSGVNLPIYSNLFNVSVNGSSPATTVYATSTFAPPSGTTPTLIPIDTSKNPPAAGTAINLPASPSGTAGVPNSMLFTPNGAKAFLGTAAGIVSLDTGTSTATLVSDFVGKVLAISPDSTNVIISNAASVPDPTTGAPAPIESRLNHQELVVLSSASSATQTFVLPGVVAAAFTPDSSRAFLSVNCSPNPCPNGNGNVYVLSFNENQTGSISVNSTVTIGTATDANNGTAVLASGPFAYFATSAGLKAMSTCNNAPQANPPITSNPQLVGSVANADMIVSVNSTGVDIESATLTPLAAPALITSTNCAPSIAYSNQFVDFGLGPFTAQQLLAPTNSANHIVVLPANTPQLLVTVPGSGPTLIPLSGSGVTQPLSGGLTLDGNTAWVGVGGTNNVHQINLSTATDALQIPTSFTKSDGSAAPPNLVAVKPK